MFRLRKPICSLVSTNTRILRPTYYSFSETVKLDQELPKEINLNLEKTITQPSPTSTSSSSSSTPSSSSPTPSSSTSQILPKLAPINFEPLKQIIDEAKSYHERLASHEELLKSEEKKLTLFREELNDYQRLLKNKNEEIIQNEKRIKALEQENGTKIELLQNLIKEQNNKMTNTENIINSKNEDLKRLENELNEYKELNLKEHKQWNIKEREYNNNVEQLKLDITELKDKNITLEKKLLSHIEKNNNFLIQYKKITATETMFKNSLNHLQQEISQLQQNPLFSEILEENNETFQNDHITKLVKLETELSEKSQKLEGYENKIKNDKKSEELKAFFAMSLGIVCAVFVSWIGIQSRKKSLSINISEEIANEEAIIEAEAATETAAVAEETATATN